MVGLGTPVDSRKCSYRRCRCREYGMSRGGGERYPRKIVGVDNKTVASGEVPPMRWEPYYRRDTRNARVLDDTPRRGYYLTNLEDFDSTFFGISPKEAVLMDPQQRISLEVTWEVLEDAGVPPQNLAGPNTAVYMGVNSDDYAKLLLEDLPGVEAWARIDITYCGIPNRISYLLDLRGPSTAVDAACASSLVAIHHGRQSLLAKETDLVIVGGVNALCGPGLTRVVAYPSGQMGPRAQPISFVGATPYAGRRRSQSGDSAHFNPNLLSPFTRYTPNCTKLVQQDWPGTYSPLVQMQPL